MDLLLVLLHGALAGLSAGALAGFIAAYIVDGDLNNPLWRKRTLAHELTAVAAHLLTGVVLALLFWLSWGLTAIVGVAWWQRGLTFAALAFGALVLPLLAIQALYMRVNARWFAAFAVDGVLTCAMVGLACAWTWSAGR